MHAVADDRTNSVSAHLTRGVGNQAMIVIENYAKTSIRQDLFDRAFHGNEFFLRQIPTSHMAYIPDTGVPGQEPSGRFGKSIRHSSKREKPKF